MSKWTVALLLLAGLATPATPAGAHAAAAVPVYPAVGPTTHLLDHAALLDDVAEPAWYEANIPFVDLPDRDIQQTYYYRWRTYKEALKYTGPKDGWIVSEFLGPVGYSAPYGGIDAAAGHHVYEGRWLRDRRYTDDYLDYWLNGSGAGPKPATDQLNDNATDWAHQYSFWAVDAAVARARVTGDWRFVLDRMPQLERQYARWKDTNFDTATGLYWQTPVWDAMEYTASSYQSDDPYHGGDGYRPTLNAYQYGDARALALLARMAGDPAKAARYEREARNLRTATEKYLWDPRTSFYKHVMRDGNPQRTPIADREQIGYIPWYFHMAPAANAAAWAQLTDPQGFAAPYGPTTTERRSPWFMHDALAGCCRWDGPSWPFATSQTLTALANQLIDYPAQSYVDRDDYYNLLRGYALTQRKDGKPYVAEAHHPDEDRWIYDGRNHSEDYNHSTFTDNVLSGLLGVRPQAGDTLRLAPLVPAGWDHFALENLPYHGRNVTVVWDRDGTAYGQGRGLRVWVDGRLRHTQASLSPVTVALTGRPSAVTLPELVDDAANVTETGHPTASASYTWRGDKAVDAIDGQDFHLDVPATRWTTYGSPNARDWLQVDLGAATVVSDVRIVFYDDGGGVRTPQSYALQYQTPAGDWLDVPGQTRSPAAPVGRAVNRVLIDPPLTTDRLRVVTTRDDGGAVGITALQLWRRPDPRVSVRFDGLVDGAIPVDAGRTVTVKTRATGRADLSLQVPRGWTARRTGPGTWQVTVPPDADVAAGLPIRALATTPAGVSSALAPTRYVFDPADFPRTLWDDDFGTDRTAAYRLDRPVAAEQAPTFTVTGGALTATSPGRAFGVLAAPVAAGDRGTAIVVEPRSFSGASPEDSLFLGLAAGAGDYALAWYNNHFGTSGADVEVAGGSRPEASGGCCADVRWEPGDRFAVMVRSGHLSTWREHDDAWTLLHDAPVDAAVPPATAATWAPAVGLRLDPGTISLDRVTVLGR
ncbi:discoidin domain-containing protein [Couchioplanes caeruleus]|uniref:MGH1-like glycoside hydrolase domain-containing protein n=1 Tax=Couchioplanes caeruleus TaxID=56438 RepID=UPI0020BEC032|nr:discoidin domain-containing protein [Couchioplanes caeruleus]UQU62207.1 discoidin domain-containing protein [Couchioplanes caeruleus]